MPRLAAGDALGGHWVSKISALFLAGNRLGRQVPKKWLDYVSASADKNLWKHYYLWEAYQVLELLGGSELTRD